MIKSSLSNAVSHALGLARTNTLARIAAFSLAALSFAACGGGDPDVFILKVASPAPADEPGSRALQRFVDTVNEESGGRIQATLYPDSSLGGDRSATEGLQLGTIEMAMTANSTLATFVPELYLFELPFLFDNTEHLFAVLDSEIGRGLAPAFEDRGFHLMGYYSFGLRHIMTAEKPIRSIEDLRGLKIRTMESPLHLEVFEAFGASPLPMAYSELYMALETGVIDGAEAANSNYYSKRFFEVAPNWAHVGWLHLVGPVIMSKPFYDRLPPDLQQLVDRTVRELAGYERELYAEVDARRLEQLRAAGVQVTYPDREAFARGAEVIYDAWAERVGGRDRIDAILNYQR